MIAEVGASVEPQVEDLAMAVGAELGLAALVDEADDGDPLVAKRLQQCARHRADVGQAARAAVAASRQIVDRDRDFAAGAALRVICMAKHVSEKRSRGLISAPAAP